MWKLSCYLLLVFLLLSANGLDTLLPTAALDFVTFSRFEKKKCWQKVASSTTLNWFEEYKQKYISWLYVPVKSKYYLYIQRPTSPFIFRNWALKRNKNMLGKGHHEIKTELRLYKKKERTLGLRYFQWKILFKWKKTFHSHLGTKSEANRYNWKSLQSDGLMLHFPLLTDPFVLFYIMEQNPLKSI